MRLQKVLSVLGLCGALMGLTAFPALADTPDMPTQYQELITSVVEDFQNGQSKNAWENGADWEQDSMYYGNYHFMDGNPSGFGYEVLDLDGNGVPELIFGDLGYCMIYDVWTIEDDKLVHLLHGWDRNAYYMTDEYRLFNEWSGGWDSYGADLYEISGSELVKIASEKEASYPVRFIDFTPFIPDESTGYIDHDLGYYRPTLDSQLTHMEGYEDAHIRPDAAYTETEHYYEIDATVTYYIWPRKLSESQDYWLGEQRPVKIRFAKDAVIEQYGEKITIGNYLKQKQGYYDCSLFFEFYDRNGYITHAQWISAG